jgi:hypothetical protein
MPAAIGPSLIVSAITADPAFSRALMSSPHVDRLNVGPIPTWKISWDQPHEGNLFEHLYRRRAFQIEHTAPKSAADASTASRASATPSSTRKKPPPGRAA